MKHKAYSFPQIDQFRHVVGNITNLVRNKGKDDQGKTIFDYTIPLPIIHYTGTVKIHGTNGSVIRTKDGTLYAQSKTRVLSLINDNMGFAAFVEKNKKAFNEIFDFLFSLTPNSNELEFIKISGEWAGKGIQSGVAVSEVDKFFAVFQIDYAMIGKDIRELNYKSIDELEDKLCICSIPFEANSIVSNQIQDIIRKYNDNRIYNIYDFGRYDIDIDFNNPRNIQNTLIEYTNNVENECPVGKYFGIKGIGEGIVWKPNDNYLLWKYDSPKLWFKVKGKEHSVSKVKTLAEVDIEKLNSINEYVEYTVTENRMNQGIKEIGLDQKLTGKFLQWLVGDIIKEESDTLLQNNLDVKDVSKAISNKARVYYFNKLNEQVGLDE